MRSGGRMELMPPPSRACLLLLRQRLSENARSERTRSKSSLLGSCATSAEPAARVGSADLRDGANRAGIAYLVTIQWISDDCSARARASASCLWTAARSHSAVRIPGETPASRVGRLTVQ
jgi:hypothetical protein